jgi:hypothetical protein
MRLYFGRGVFSEVRKARIRYLCAFRTQICFLEGYYPDFLILLLVGCVSVCGSWNATDRGRGIKDTPYGVANRPQRYATWQIRTALSLEKIRLLRNGAEV